MITLDLNKSLLDLDNTPIFEDTNKPIKMGALMAQQLITSNEGDALKFLDWAIVLKQGKPLTLDSSDKETFINFVKSSKTLTNLSKGRILQEIAQSK